MSTAAISSRRKRRPKDHGRHLLAAVLAVLAAYTAATAALPVLRFTMVSAELRVLIEVVQACIALFTALVMLVPADDNIDPAENAFVAALIALGTANGVFAVGAALILGETRQGSGYAFYLWLAARYFAAMLFVVAGMRVPRLSARAYLAVLAAGLAATAVAWSIAGDALPLTAFPGNRGGMTVRLVTPAEQIGISLVPALLFAVGAVLAWRVYRRHELRLFLWLSLALWVQVFSKVHELFYRLIMGPFVTSADLLRAVMLLLLLAAAIGKVRLLFAERGAMLQAQAAELHIRGEMIRRLARLAEREDAFRSIVVHELATPVATIRAFAHVAGLHLRRLESAPGDLRDAIQGVESESRRLQELIARMDELRAIEVDDFRCELRPVRLGPLLEEVAAYLRALPEPRKAVVLADNVTVRGDAVRLSQALRDVVANAVRYSPPYSTVYLESRIVGEGKVQVAVEDEGPGIPREERERVLRKYVRGNSGAQSDGTGLGLYVASRIAEAHGGRLMVTEGEHGGGARLVLELESTT